ncbi:MAG: VWA domain-containing protein [Chromatiales bacterium]|nr:VWA domain-containing protein [Chromatiales bacterium]
MSTRGIFLIRAGLRALAVVLLLIAIADPGLPIGRPTTDIAVLLDDSASVRHDVLDEAWHRIADTIPGFPQGRTDIFRFAAEPLLELSYAGTREEAAGSVPRTRELDRGSTDIAAALEAALRRLRPGRPGAVVIATDGIENRGDAAPLIAGAGRAGVTVLVADLRVSVREPRLVEWWIPEQARVGQTVETAAIVRSTRGGDIGIEIVVDDVVLESRSLALVAGGDATARFLLQPAVTGAMRIGFRLTDPGGAEIAAEQLAGVIDVYGPPAVLFVANNPDPALARSLRAGGFTVDIVSPAQLSGQSQQLDRYHAIVLDDIAASKISATTQNALAAAVSGRGTGLVVLGGPSSFAAGGYRHSELERLLPVTAEPPEPQREATVMFLVDNSGSMGQAPQGATRLDVAREAVLETANSLSGSDVVALSSFNIQPELHLRPGRYADPRAALRDAWRFPAQGGTTLAPALELAAETMAGSDDTQKLLILVTDGFIEGTDLLYGRQVLADNRIELIALAIGEGSDLAALESLASAYEGRVLLVDRLAELPRLMRNEVEARREPTFTGTTELRIDKVLPPEFSQAETWPSVDGFSVVRANEDASVFLRATRGEPVLAEHMAGAGRVLVFTPGIGAFTARWSNWQDWPMFAGGLIERVSPLLPSGRIGISVADEAGYLAIDIDARDRSGGWLTGAPPRLNVTRPNGTKISLPALAGAAGRFTARVPAASAGLYTIGVNAGEAIIRKSHVRNVLAEQSVGPDEGPLDDWIADGLVTPFSDKALQRLTRSATAPARPYLTGIALSILLLLWACERVWTPVAVELSRIGRRLNRRLGLRWTDVKA